MATYAIMAMGLRRYAYLQYTVYSIWNRNILPVVIIVLV